MKFITVLFIGFASAAIVAAGKKHHGNDQDHVGYKFEYGVHDPHTHDIKTHHEERHGKHVTGYYTLKEPDGTTRVVHYKAGPHTGFEAVVEIIGHPHHPNHHGHGHSKGHGDDNGHHGHEHKKDHGNNGKHDHGYAVHEDHEDYTRHHGYQDEEDDEY